MAILLFMAVTHTGYVTVPGLGEAISLMHVPVILGGIISGPVVGALLGLVFGYPVPTIFNP